jgi:predicted kinase
MSEDDQKEVDKMLDNRYRNGIRAKERHIVIDMTNLSPKSRRKWVSTARGYKVIMTVFLTSIEESYEFNQARVGKKLPKSLLMNMASRFIHPTMDECHEVRYV